MRYLVPHGCLLVRIDDAIEKQGTITLGVADKQPWATVLQVGAMDTEHVGFATVGDRIRFRKHTDEEVELLMPDSPDVVQCEECWLMATDPERPENCRAHTDAVTGKHLGHVDVNLGPQVEPLAVISIENVLVVATERSEPPYVN